MKRIKSLCAALLGLLLLPVFAQPAHVPFELAQRLAGSQARIYVGRMPPKARLPFRLPLPPGTRVVGSTALPLTGVSFDWVALYLASSRLEFDFLGYYRSVFRELGWRQGQTYEQTGFLGSDMQEPDGSLTFCKTEQDRETNVYLTLTNGPEATLIDAQVQTMPVDGGWGACDQNNDYAEPPLPALAAPEGSETEIVDIFSGSSPVGNGGSLIILHTELAAGALLEHYAEQLELSGWREVTALAEGNVRVTTYRFGEKDEPFSGTLQITALDEPGRYLVQLTVTKV